MKRSVKTGFETASSQDFVNWVCTDAILPEFLMYALIAEGEDIRKFGKGNNSHNDLFPRSQSVPCCLPPLNEQRRIVAKIEELFSDLDAGVAALRACEGESEAIPCGCSQSSRRRQAHRRMARRSGVPPLILEIQNAADAALRTNPLRHSSHASSRASPEMGSRSTR